MHSKEFWYSTSKGKHTIASSLDVKTHSSNDNPKLSKEENKRDLQSNKKLLQELGELPVNSGWIALMTNNF